MKHLNTRTLALLGLLSACVIILGYLSIPLPGGLSLTLNIIPIAIAAIALGPMGGLVIGCVFGMVSFLQCFGIFGFSGMGATTLSISVFKTLVQRLLPRALDGLLTGLIASYTRKIMNEKLSFAITGFSAAFLNTLFFMSALVLLFQNTDFMKEKMGVLTPMMYILTSIGVQAIIEMIASTIITTAVGVALHRTKRIA